MDEGMLGCGTGMNCLCGRKHLSTFRGEMNQIWMGQAKILGHYMFILKLAFTNYYRYVDKSYNLDPCYTRTRLNRNKFVFHLRRQYFMIMQFLNAKNVLFQIEENYITERILFFIQVFIYSFL